MMAVVLRLAPRGLAGNHLDHQEWPLGMEMFFLALLFVCGKSQLLQEACWVDSGLSGTDGMGTV